MTVVEEHSDNILDAFDLLRREGGGLDGSQHTFLINQVAEIVFYDDFLGDDVEA